MPEANNSQSVLKKCKTGIKGLDEITGGGLPERRPTLLCGGAGCGKTLLAMEFIIRGAVEHNEPGLFVSFEENKEELTQNVASLGWDLNKLIEEKKIIISYIYIEPSEIKEMGEYDLEGLFVRIDRAINSIGVKRVVMDTLEAVFSGFTNMTILRAEFRRLFRWLKNKGVTAVITAEQGDSTMTRHNLEQYVSDCVILLDQQIKETILTRRLRVVKYRGSNHGSNEYPFIIDQKGISVLPITSLGLEHEVSTEIVFSGIPRLDTMLGGNGYYRGTSVLISGTAGTGKTSIAASFIQATCQRGETCIFFAFEESMNQIIRNMRSIGIDLEKWVKNGLLLFHVARPTLYGLEMHLVTMHKLIDEFRPKNVVVDPISNLNAVGTTYEAQMMLLRLMDFLKARQITSLFTDLTVTREVIDQTEVGVSSLMDTWIVLKSIEAGGERNRGLYVIKSRGMSHSNQSREFLLTSNGLELVDVYVGQEGVLTGTARFAQEVKEKERTLRLRQELESKKRELERKRRIMELQIESLQAQFEGESEELETQIQSYELAENRLDKTSLRMAELRKSDGM
ncbi:MAG: circadian clock protein KaiC [Deltaproteobacteria bacterium]|nr:circadian clock protein KaiC [Deltaproteobacteria bacterium]MBF0523645.1 circadian clock protein KaiC [Deltaproteobacteria bacterium]